MTQTEERKERQRQARKARSIARSLGTYLAARYLRNRGYPLEVARAILLQRWNS